MKKKIRCNYCLYFFPLIVFVTTDRSEARVDPLTALLVQGQTGKYQAGVSRAT